MTSGDNIELINNNNNNEDDQKSILDISRPNQHHQLIEWESYKRENNESIQPCTNYTNYTERQFMNEIEIIFGNENQIYNINNNNNNNNSIGDDNQMKYIPDNNDCNYNSNANDDISNVSNEKDNYDCIIVEESNSSLTVIEESNDNKEHEQIEKRKDSNSEKNFE